MKPQFFAEPSRALFGIHSPANGLAETGVVLCPPMGQEALRAYRALRLLADQIADAGAEAFRFDYFGSGDSAGDTRAGRPSHWIEDIRFAVQHLREATSVRRIVVVGLRLGGTLALVAEIPAVSRLILWDPVLDARAYVASMAPPGARESDEEWEVAGFPVVRQVRTELQALNVDAARRVPPEVRIVVSQESDSVPALQASLEKRRARVEIERIPAPPAWVQDETFGLGAVPAAVLRRIATWVN